MKRATEAIGALGRGAQRGQERSFADTFKSSTVLITQAYAGVIAPS